MPCCRSCRCPRAFPSARWPSVNREPPTPHYLPPRSSAADIPRFVSAFANGVRSAPATSSPTRRSSPHPDLVTAIAPGSTIGILGGGQLGRMTAMAARSLGYSVHVLDPDPDCPAKSVSDRCITAPFDDVDAASDLARHCDVVTLEIEQIGVNALDAAARHAPVRPAAAILGIIQD